MDVLRTGPSDVDVRAVMILTDGVPNRGPSADNVVKSYRKKYPVAQAFTVNTFAYGFNSIKSDLLLRTAQLGGGTYTYVCPGMIGTSFCNSVAAILTTAASNVTIQYKGKGGDKEIMVGRLCFGQSQTFAVPDCQRHSAVPVLKYNRGDDVYTAYTSAPEREHSPYELTYHRHRILLANALTEPSAAAIKELQRRARKDIHIPGVAPLLDDQIPLALRPDYYTKWGRHYLLFLGNCLQHHYRGTFKDPCLRDFGGECFDSVVQEASETFDLLPPPAPRTVGAQGAVVRSMASFNNPSSACFVGHCRVHMADGSRKPARDIRPGDKVVTGDGTTTTIDHVLKTVIEKGEVNIIHFPTGLQVTHWHPVFVKDAFRFPYDTQHPERIVPADAIYSFSVATPGASTVMIEDVPVLTLGHGIEGDEVASHTFWGNKERVFASFPADEQYHTVRDDAVMKDPVTGQATGFRLI